MMFRFFVATEHYEELFNNQRAGGYTLLIKIPTYQRAKHSWRWADGYMVSIRIDY